MAQLETALSDLGVWDRLARQDTPLHRLDPRAKVIVTTALLITTVSYPRYEVAALTPLFLYPAALIAVGRLPVRVLCRYLLLACPFAVLVGVFNPIMDRELAVRWGPVGLSWGWLSFFSILARFLLTVSAALVLMAGTGYSGICGAVGRLGAPRLLVLQLLLLYRYLFVLTAEAARMARAHALRSPGGRGAAVPIWGSLAGHLLLRAYDRSRRIHTAMCCRGFDGVVRTLRRPAWSWRDSCFLAGWGAFFASARWGDPATRLGDLVLGFFR